MAVAKRAVDWPDSDSGRPPSIYKANRARVPVSRIQSSIVVLSASYESSNLEATSALRERLFSAADDCSRSLRPAGRRRFVCTSSEAIFALSKQSACAQPSRVLHFNQAKCYTKGDDMAQRDTQTNLRLPSELKKWLQEQADSQHRSLSAEVVIRLESTRSTAPDAQKGKQ